MKNFILSAYDFIVNQHPYLSITLCVIALTVHFFIAWKKTKNSYERQMRIIKGGGAGIVYKDPIQEKVTTEVEN